MGITRRTRQAIETYGSPPFTFLLGAIAAGESAWIEFADNTTYGRQIEKYLPLDFLEVQNDAGEDLKVYVNGDVAEFSYVPAFGKLTLRGHFWRVRVENVDGSASTAANEVRVTGKLEQHNADKDALQSRARRVFGGLF